MDVYDVQRHQKKSAILYANLYANDISYSKEHSMRTILFACCLTVSTFAWGERSTSSTGNYENDLGQIYGAIQGVRFMNEICSQAFPELAVSNEMAFQSWRKRYLPFLQEVNRHWAALIERETNGDPSKHKEFSRYEENYLDQLRQSLRAQMSSSGSDLFFETCSGYPRYLTTERRDIEHFFAEQVTTMRRGPAKPP